MINITSQEYFEIVRKWGKYSFALNDAIRKGNFKTKGIMCDVSIHLIFYNVREMLV